MAIDDAEQAYWAWLYSARKQVGDLLLNRGLYQTVDLTPPRPIDRDAWIAALPETLHMDCDMCSEVGQTTWHKEPGGARSPGLYVYTCMSCNMNMVEFMLVLADSKTEQKVVGLLGQQSIKLDLLSYSIEKTGQYPAWEAPLSRTLSKALGKEGKSLFIKGASSLRAGRGIGAVAYFRRIIENHIDDILKMVAESAAATGDTAAIEQIKGANRNLYASDRLKIAAQHTPPHLKPGGHSPLDVMYGAFSEGLHALSDEESADVATKLLESITYFFEMWQENKDRAERFAQTITKAATKSS